MLITFPFLFDPMQMLREVLWYIDGSHSTLEEREYGVPTLLQKFQGYKNPYHQSFQKRTHHNLSHKMLITHSQTLFSLLMKDFWSKLAWKKLKQSIKTLAHSSMSYANLLIEKKSWIELIYKSPEIVRTVGGEHYSEMHTCPCTFMERWR